MQTCVGKILIFLSIFSFLACQGQMRGALPAQPVVHVEDLLLYIGIPDSKVITYSPKRDSGLPQEKTFSLLGYHLPTGQIYELRQINSSTILLDGADPGNVNATQLVKSIEGGFHFYTRSFVDSNTFLHKLATFPSVSGVLVEDLDTMGGLRPKLYRFTGQARVHIMSSTLPLLNRNAYSGGAIRSSELDQVREWVDSGDNNLYFLSAFDSVPAIFSIYDQQGDLKTLPGGLDYPANRDLSYLRVSNGRYNVLVKGGGQYAIHQLSGTLSGNNLNFSQLVNFATGGDSSPSLTCDATGDCLYKATNGGSTVLRVFDSVVGALLLEKTSSDASATFGRYGPWEVLTASGATTVTDTLSQQTVNFNQFAKWSLGHDGLKLVRGFDVGASSFDYFLYSSQGSLMLQSPSGIFSRLGLTESALLGVHFIQKFQNTIHLRFEFPNGGKSRYVDLALDLDHLCFKALTLPMDQN